MNRQPISNTAAIRTLSHSPNRTAAHLSTKENPMSRRIATVLFSLFAILILSACAAQSPFQTAGSVTVLPEAAASDLQISDRQHLAEYQATLPAISLKFTAPRTAKASSAQINDRQQLADYQANLSAFAVVATAPMTTVKASGVQINSRQQLADYQASLPLYTSKASVTGTRVAVTTVPQISNRQELADYQASLR
ncbi:MAG: hypothetical protein WBO46_01685 [Caldilineaceae bacterium]